MLFLGLGNIYEGNFFNGMMHGYGVLIERPKISKNKTFEKIKNKEKDDFSFDTTKEEKKLKDLEENDEKVKDEIFYEGEFSFGYRHGIGRYYYKQGSYLYGEWRFDKSFGNSIK